MLLSSLRQIAKRRHFSPTTLICTQVANSLESPETKSHLSPRTQANCAVGFTSPILELQCFIIESQNKDTNHTLTFLVNLVVLISTKAAVTAFRQPHAPISHTTFRYTHRLTQCRQSHTGALFPGHSRLCHTHS